MRKSGWVSFCGWASFGLVLFALSAAMLARGESHPPIPAAVAALALLLAVPAAGLWVLGTVVHRFRVGGARIKAQAFVEAQARAVGVVCRQCQKGHAVVTCTTHGVPLCPVCWGAHHKEGCSYSQLTVASKSPVAMVR